MPSISATLETQVTFSDLLDYDPETGVFTWKARNVRPSHVRTDKGWNSRRAGTVAGTLKDNGYLRIRVGGTHVYAHRLALFFINGRWPPEDVDHANGLRTDNRAANLREATRSQNCANARKPKNNKSGFKGVCKAANGKWVAQIGGNSQVKFLGHFDTPEEAHSVYAAALQARFGEFARTA